MVGPWTYECIGLVRVILIVQPMTQRRGHADLQGYEPQLAHRLVLPWLERNGPTVLFCLALPCTFCARRDIMAELAPATVRPLVVMLRDSQEASGPGYTLHDVLHGMANNRQVCYAAHLNMLGTV